ncbi:MAG: MGMT family protein [Armatimonadetes bacterium]|nr:MGMT family protein [Armatimonadota bacterium]
MPYKRKSWTQKWAEAKAKPGFPMVFDCDKTHKRWVVPAPSEIEEIVKTIPRGKVMPIGEIAAQIMAKHKTEMCCPMTTGIFTWLLSYASCEAEGLNVAEDCGKRINPKAAHRGVPWWRVVKTGGELNPKYPGAPELQKALLESEGIKVVAKGKKLVVA